LKKQASQQNAEYNRLADEHNRTVSFFPPSEDQADDRLALFPTRRPTRREDGVEEEEVETRYYTRYRNERVLLAVCSLQSAV